MITINELTPSQQDELLTRLNEFYVSIDPYSGTQYVHVFGECIDYNSIKNFKLLQG